MIPPKTRDAGARVAVLGPGSWGTALSLLLCRNGHQVRLWGHNPDEIADLRRDRENRRFLPGVPLPDAVRLMTDLDEALSGIDALLIVVPSHAFGQVIDQLVGRLPPHLGVAWATKGFAPGQANLLHEVAARLGERDLAVISGPSFAGEVARERPTAVTVAATAPSFGQLITTLLHSKCFRPYTSDDLVGVEVCGAAKNVLAIATGIADGLQFGANARAALITRGLAELSRLGVALGGRRETFTGLSGLGDLVLTCTDNQSRNRRMGLALAKGQSVADAKREIGQEVEGLLSASSVRQLATRLRVEMPISEQVYRVLYEEITPEDATRALLERDAKSEFD